MNKNRTLIACALALSVSWLGCNKSGKLDETSASTPPAGPVELKLKWPVGEHILQQMDMKTAMEMSLPTQAKPMKQDMTMGQEYSLIVLPAPPGGGHEVEMEFMGAHMKMEAGGKTMMDYDSAKTDAADVSNPTAAVLKKIVGAKIRYTMDVNNNVVRVEGINDLVNRLTSGTDATTSSMFKSMFSEEYFKQMMSQNQCLPTKPVQKGDTWPVQIKFPMGSVGSIDINYTYTFQGWEMHGKQNCVRMNFQGTLKSKPKAKSNAFPVSLSSLDGDSTGTSWFDPELGIIVDTTINQNVTMVMSMVMKGATQNMTNHMNQDTTIKLVSIK